MTIPHPPFNHIPYRRRKSSFEQLLVFIAFITLALSAITYWGRDFWVGELLSNCRHLLLVPTVLCGLYFLMRGQWLWIFLTGTCLIMNGLPMLPFFGISEFTPTSSSTWESSSPTPPSEETTATHSSKKPEVSASMLIANIYQFNHSYTKITDQILQADVDLVALVEVTQATRQMLSANAELKKRFPYQHYSYSTTAFLLSRTPLFNTKDIDANGYYLKSVLLQANTHIGEHELAVWITHPPHSTNRLNFLKKQDFLDFFKGYPLPDKLLLVGDMNMTPWSNHFQDFMTITQLKNASAGFGYKPTWPVKRDFPPLFPIDHAFFKGPITITDWTAGEPLGSDHLPIRLTFNLHS